MSEKLYRTEEKAKHEVIGRRLVDETQSEASFAGSAEEKKEEGELQRCGSKQGVRGRIFASPASS